MRLEELTENNSVRRNVAELAQQAGLDVIDVTKITINNIYDEYVVDVDLPKFVEDVTNSKEFSQLPEIKEFRTSIKEEFGETNLRGKTVVGHILFGPRGNKTGRLVFQLKGYKI